MTIEAVRQPFQIGVISEPECFRVVRRRRVQGAEQAIRQNSNCQREEDGRQLTGGQAPDVPLRPW